MQTVMDIERIEKRFQAWWQGQMADRPPVTISITPAPYEPPVRRHASLRDRWMDTEYVLDCFEQQHIHSTYIGDTLPVFMPNLGPDLCATAYGAQLDFGEVTSWSSPILKSARDATQLVPNFDNLYWNKIHELTAQSMQRSRGRWLTALPDLHTNGDLLAALRGSEELCLDVVDDYNGVAAALAHLGGHYQAIYEAFYDVLAAAGEPMTTWSPFVCRKKVNIVSCDFICMISPQMYADLIEPALQDEIRYLDLSLFHLDGPGALKHLDAMLELDGLNGVQWVYGAGCEPAARWIEVYQKIQQAGKAIHAMCTDPADALAVAEHLRPEGVWLHVEGEHPLEAAKDLVKAVENWH